MDKGESLLPHFLRRQYDLTMLTIQESYQQQEQQMQLELVQI